MNFHSGKLMRLLQSRVPGIIRTGGCTGLHLCRMDVQLEVEPGALARVFASNLVTSKSS
jgi:hypothetical protein